MVGQIIMTKEIHKTVQLVHVNAQRIREVFLTETCPTIFSKQIVCMDSVEVKKLRNVGYKNYDFELYRARCLSGRID